MSVTAIGGMVTREIAGRRDFLALAAADPARYPCVLESVAPGPAIARHDLLFVHDGDAIVAPAHADDAGDFRFLDALDAAWQAERVERSVGGPPFRGGWVLMLGYELAAECEPRLRLPAPPVAMPRAIALRCPAAAIYDHRRDVTALVAEPAHAAWLDRLERALAPHATPATIATPAASVREDDPARYLDGVRRVHGFLADGDVFQVNLSRGWQATMGDADPVALYRRLRVSNPAPFAGLFRHGGHAVLSSSPERLVSVRGGIAQTRPIAGTRPRLPGDDDGARVRELIGHPKERAEHIMLIDLERNDLGRVCEPGSIEVDELMSVESYAHVHHIVSNVRGRLRAGATPGQVIRATFPGGTITGCPKVRCMEIIASLEATGRGPYTGALGYLNRDGEMDLNILIRTIWLHDGVARIRAGSGIVVDSDPERELEETRAKARGMLRALEPA